MHKYLKIFIVIVTAVVFKNVLQYFLDEPEIATTGENTTVKSASNRIFTIDELSGEKNKLLLAILGILLLTEFSNMNQAIINCFLM